MSTNEEELGEELQRSNWNIADSFLNSVFEAVDNKNVEESFENLFEVNIILTKNLVIYYLLRYQRLKDDASSYGFLAAKLNSIFPMIGAALVKEATAQFIESYNKRDRRATLAMLSFLSRLFDYEVVHEIVILQIVHLLLENFDDFSTNLVISLLRDCGKHLMEVSNTAHNMIYEKLRELLQDGKLLYTTSKTVEDLFDFRRMNYQPSQSKLSLASFEGETHIHTFIIDDNNTIPSKSLKDFTYSPDFMETELTFQALKEHVLHDISKEDSPPEKILIAKDMTGNDEVEFKKRIYLILKSSLSGDEAAHKILKLRVPDNQKYRVVDVIVRSSLQESTYSKFYGLLSERLCSSHKSWRPAFEKIFQQNYDDCGELEPFQLRTIGKFWGHILASDYIGFEVLEYVHMGEEETTAPGRIFLKFMMQELVADLGIEELNRRLADEYIQPFLKNLLPLSDPAKMRYSINYFTAIGLGAVTEKMREKLNIINESIKEGKQVGMQAGGDTKRGRDRFANVRDTKSQDKKSSFGSNQTRHRSKTPPRRQRRTSVTPPRRKDRSRSPVTRRGVQKGNDK